MSAPYQLIGVAVGVFVSLAITGAFLRAICGCWPWAGVRRTRPFATADVGAAAPKGWDISKKGCGLPCGYDCNGACFLTTLSDRQTPSPQPNVAVPIAYIEPDIFERLKAGTGGMFPISNSKFRSKELTVPLYAEPSPNTLTADDLKHASAHLLGVLRANRRWINNSLAKDETIAIDNAVEAIRALTSEGSEG